MAHNLITCGIHFDTTALLHIYFHIKKAKTEQYHGYDLKLI